MNTTQLRVIQTTASLQALPLKTYLKIGYAHSAVLARKISRKHKKDEASLAS